MRKFTYFFNGEIHAELDYALLPDETQEGIYMFNRFTQRWYINERRRVIGTRDSWLIDYYSIEPEDVPALYKAWLLIL